MSEINYEKRFVYSSYASLFLPIVFHIVAVWYLYQAHQAGAKISRASLIRGVIILIGGLVLNIASLKMLGPLYEQYKATMQMFDDLNSL